MGAWAIASLLIFGVIWNRGDAYPQTFSNYNEDFNNNSYLFKSANPHEEQHGLYNSPSGNVLQSHSASDLESQKLKLANAYFPVRSVRYIHRDPIENAHPIYENFDQSFERTLEGYQRTAEPALANHDHHDRIGIERQDLSNTGYDDYKTSQATHLVGPYQLENIQSEHFHKEVPAYDISGLQHYGRAQENHGEIHYHQHKHIHRHEHKQEHVHQHKQDHQHKHVHNQQHHHNSQHKHEHDHKHNHHQQHKHDHHHNHKHNSHNKPKHEHHHGHKHQGHKRGYKHY